MVYSINWNPHISSPWVVFHPLFSPNISERYLKWRNSENLYKLYVCGLCKGVFPPQNGDGMVLDPSLEEPLQVLKVEVEKQGAFYVHCTIYKMSGAEVLNEELPADTTWWHLSRECYRKHGMANVDLPEDGQSGWTPVLGPSSDGVLRGKHKV